MQKELTRVVGELVAAAGQDAQVAVFDCDIFVHR